MGNIEKYLLMNPKEGILTNRAIFLQTYFKICCPLSIVFSLYFGIQGLLLTSVISFFAAVSVIIVADKVSDFTKILYGVTNANISIREQMEGTLKAVKVAKFNKDFPKALRIVNSILMKDPEFQNALFVKAQILHEGFNNTGGAKKYLKTIINSTEPSESINIWASSLYKQLCTKLN